MVVGRSLKTILCGRGLIHGRSRGGGGGLVCKVLGVYMLPNRVKLLPIFKLKKRRELHNAF